MSWKEATAMKQRKEYVVLAKQEGANISELCRRYGISRKTGYKWLCRAQGEEEEWYRDRSRRPMSMPNRISEEVEREILSVRDEHNAWGGRKIRNMLEKKGMGCLPSASTITAALHRHGRIAPEESAKHDPMRRFEKDKPNELWQMDFKGRFQTAAEPCHALTIIDDHSRFAVCVAACADQKEKLVKDVLTGVFRVYGLPERMLMDNGACWKNTDSPYTRLTAWLLKLGVGVSHGRPYHPQTQGKNERFNRTLKAEAIKGRLYRNLVDCQRAFDRFRDCYNIERPHEAIQMEVPASRYRVSVFAFPEELPAPEYLDTDIVRKVTTPGLLSFHKAHYYVGRAFVGEYLAMRTTVKDGVLAVYFYGHQVATINVIEKKCVQR
jgi:transposase InsO family protein